MDVSWGKNTAKEVLGLINCYEAGTRQWTTLMESRPEEQDNPADWASSSSMFGILASGLSTNLELAMELTLLTVP